jgi:hypothetical protein
MPTSITKRSCWVEIPKSRGNLIFNSWSPTQQLDQNMVKFPHRNFLTANWLNQPTYYSRLEFKELPFTYLLWISWWIVTTYQYHQCEIIFAFSILAKFLMMGYHPNTTTLTAFFRVLCLTAIFRKQFTLCSLLIYIIYIYIYRFQQENYIQSIFFSLISYIHS